MRRYGKIIINIILIVILMFTISPNSFAKKVPQQILPGEGSGTGSDSTLGGVASDAEDFLSQGQSGDVINEDALISASNVLYNTLLVIGIGVALIWGAVLGIQFITGTLEAKADVQKGLVTYVIGCVIIFGAFGIWKIVINLLKPLAG